MSRPFVMRRGAIRVRLGSREVEILRRLPALLESVGDDAADPAAVRLAPQVYRDDAEASEEWRRFAQPELAQAREQDRSSFVESLDRNELTPEEAEGWMRTIGEARLVLGARLGITEDGWSTEVRTDPAHALLHYLSWLQEELVGVLTGTLRAAP